MLTGKLDTCFLPDDPAWRSSYVLLYYSCAVQT